MATCSPETLPQKFQTALAHKMAAASTALSGLQQMRPPWLHKPGPGPISLGRASPPQAPKLAHVSNFDRGLNWALRAVSQSTGQNISRPLTVDFNGNWVKDKKASDSMDEAVAFMQLNGVVRQAIKLVSSVEIKQDKDTFQFAVFSSLFPWFKVRETYQLSGEPMSCKRRDLRAGQVKGRAVPQGPQLMLMLEWDEPFGGSGTDMFEMPAEGVLHVSSTINVHGKTCKYRSVYNKK